MRTRLIAHEEVQAAARRLVASLPRNRWGAPPRIYGVPRGGIPVAYVIAGLVGGEVTDSPVDADLVVDDLIDTGRTLSQLHRTFPDKLYAVLFQKRPALVEFSYHFGARLEDNDWLVFPWEKTMTGDSSREDAVVRMMQAIGENPEREGLKDTPSRVVKAWGEWFGGYDKRPEDFLKTFSDGAEGYDGMIIVDNIPIYSHCEHHITPFVGKAHVGYIPDKRIVGLSKIPKIVDMFSRRLQVQERLTRQIADTIMEHLQPRGAIVSITAAHFCMVTRGVKLADAQTTTSARRGLFEADASACSEFFSLIPSRSAL